MNCSKNISAIALAISVSALAATSASAQNPGFELGNLFLGFQSTGGTGVSNYLLVNIGDSAPFFRDATTNQINLMNINAALTAQFGANWADRTDLFMGAGASWSNDEFGDPERHGDPFNTLYVGNPRQTLGIEGQPGSTGFSLTPAQIQDASNGLFAAGTVFETQGTSGTASIPKSGGFTGTFVDYDDQNPINAGVQGAAYNGVFSGGVQTAFGPGTFGLFGGVNSEAALDLYRIGSTSGTSTYEGTILLDGLGNVSFVVAPIPEPSSSLLLALTGAAIGFVRRRQATAA
jgi:hypothetical protein